jgi:hypothetical protein
MSGNDWQQGDRHVTCRDVIVRVTQPGGHHLDQDFTGAGFVQIELEDLELAGLAQENRCSGFHRGASSLWVGT